MSDLWESRQWSPMLLKEIDKPFDSKDYIYELKFDGIRAICFANSKGINLISRNGIDMVSLFPELSNIKKIVKKNVIFDGEIVLFDKGKPSFTAIQNRLHLKNRQKIEQNAIENPVVFVVFDILYEGKNLINLPLMKRKSILDGYPDTDVFVKTKYYSKGPQLFNMVKKKGLEGIVAKAKEGIYHPSKRTYDFIKIKNIQREKFWICGYSPNSKNDTISLVLGEKQDERFKYVGKVVMSTKKNLYEKILKCKPTKNVFVENLDGVTFIDPKFSCDIEYLEKTESGHLRHPVYRGD